MENIYHVKEMQQRCRDMRFSGKRIAFVPTMGFFHEGHLELMRVGREKSDILVVSIFVNPTQFAPTEDFDEYPRDTEGDLAKAEKVGADIVFMPDCEEMYPDSFQTTISIEKVTKYLCGLSRPHFFGGVATVVAKLFNIVMPSLAIFGQKDFQQLTVVRRMVKDLNMDIDIVGVPIVRESDGLAMSSRNKYLGREERRSALSLKESIDRAVKMVEEGERKSENIISAIRSLILSYPYTEIDYVNICDPITMEDRDSIEGERLLALAVKVGKTRLIDNTILQEKQNIISSR
ncbi:MAG: pantoate--beta-alanine ligase [Deltaproteobacteria bacterium]|nr:pantoate--beta-alanine ligase [Deltaproteobacteria bacterium]